MKILQVPRELFVLMLAMIIANTSHFMYYPLMPLYLESLGASVREIGFLFTLEVIFALCFRIIGGWASDTFGRLQTIAVGSVVGVISMFALVLAPTWQWVILSTLLLEAAVSMVAPSFQAYTAEQAPEGSTSSTFGLVNGLFFICMIIGPLLGGFLVDRYGFRAMLWAATVIYTAASVLRIWMAKRARFQMKTLQAAALLKDIRGLLGMMTAGGLLMWLFITDGLMDMGYQLVIPFLPKYMTEISGVSESGYGSLFALMSAVGAITMLPCGMFADRFGERWSLALGLCLTAAVWSLVIINGGIPLYVLAFGLAGMGRSFIEPAFASLLSQSVPASSRGMAWGVFMTALGVVAIPAPYIGGLAYDHWQPSAPFVLAVILALLTLPMVLSRLRLPPRAEQVELAESSLAALETSQV